MKPLLIANWKMHFSPRLAARVAAQLVKKLQNGVDVVICPSFTHLTAVRHELIGSGIRLGAQDVFYEQEGPYTGEVAASQLRETGVEYVMVGHSERRILFDETSETVGKKLQACVKQGLQPVLMVGDTSAERRAHREVITVRRQLRKSLQGLKSCPKMVIAYEPVWAISTFGGGVIRRDEVSRMVKLIRSECVKKWGERAVARGIRFVFGGSVNASNVAEMVDRELVTGAVVGAASLVVSEFVRVARAIRG